VTKRDKYYLVSSGLPPPPSLCYSLFLFVVLYVVEESSVACVLR
jgi:hypothetical protein